MSELPEQELRVDVDGAVEFLRGITEAGVVGNVAAIHPVTAKCTARSFDAQSLDDARRFIEAHQHENLYWTVNALGSRVDKKPTKPDIAYMRFAHLDLDDPSEEALAKIRAHPLPPTLIIFSGGGYGAFWKLAEPIHVNGNLAELESVNNAFIQEFKAGAGTQNIDRLMRLPSTVNRLSPTKLARGRKPAAARVVEHHPERAYSLEQLRGSISSPPATPAPPAQATTEDDRSTDLYRRVFKDVRAGRADYEIVAMHSAHPHAQDQKHPDRAVKRCIEKARELLHLKPDEESARPTFRFFTPEEFMQRPNVTMLIRGIVPAQGIVVVFGPPKEGKTYCTFDMLMHAAAGLDWMGRRISRAIRVAYLAGEGANGLRVRMKAWYEQHPEVTWPVQIRIFPYSLSLPEHAAELAEQMREFRPEIVTTDTLNTFFGGGDENATVDMTVFCDAVRLLRDLLECTVLVIHHTGHSNAERERGSIVLRASSDTIIRVAKDKDDASLVGFQVITARDMEAMEQPLALRLVPVSTKWADDEGVPLVACVVRAADQEVRLPSATDTKTRPPGTYGLGLHVMNHFDRADAPPEETLRWGEIKDVLQEAGHLERDNTKAKMPLNRILSALVEAGALAKATDEEGRDIGYRKPKREF